MTEPQREIMRSMEYSEPIVQLAEKYPLAYYYDEGSLPKKSRQLVLQSKGNEYDHKVRITRHAMSFGVEVIDCQHNVMCGILGVSSRDAYDTYKQAEAILHG